MRILPPAVIGIELQSTLVTFKADDIIYDLLPIVHLGAHRGPVLRALFGYHITGFGEPAPDGTTRSIRVLERVPAEAAAERAYCLAKLFLHGLAHIINQYTFRFRPVVEVRGASALQATLGADARDTIERALKQAGARRVDFREA